MTCCDGRNADKIDVNQDEHQTWKEVTRAILSHPSNVVDVSARGTIGQVL